MPPTPRPHCGACPRTPITPHHLDEAAQRALERVTAHSGSAKPDLFLDPMLLDHLGPANGKSTAPSRSRRRLLVNVHRRDSTAGTERGRPRDLPVHHELRCSIGGRAATPYPLRHRVDPAGGPGDRRVASRAARGTLRGSSRDDPRRRSWRLPRRHRAPHHQRRETAGHESFHGVNGTAHQRRRRSDPTCYAQHRSSRQRYRKSVLLPAGTRIIHHFDLPARTYTVRAANLE